MPDTHTTAFQSGCRVVDMLLPHRRLVPNRHPQIVEVPVSTQKRIGLMARGFRYMSGLKVAPTEVNLVKNVTKSTS